MDRRTDPSRSTAVPQCPQSNGWGLFVLMFGAYTVNSVCWVDPEPIPYVFGPKLSYEQFRAKYDPIDSPHNRSKKVFFPEPYPMSC